MPQYISPLDNLRVAAPCPADWQQMTGSDEKRFCSECQLNVYNLSAMTKLDAERLLLKSEGRLCVRYYRRADGTILTQNCPRGLAAVKRRAARMATAVFSTVMAFVAGVGAHAGFTNLSYDKLRRAEQELYIDQGAAFATSLDETPVVELPGEHELTQIPTFVNDQKFEEGFAEEGTVFLGGRAAFSQEEVAEIGKRMDKNQKTRRANRKLTAR